MHIFIFFILFNYILIIGVLDNIMEDIDLKRYPMEKLRINNDEKVYKIYQ